VAVKRVMSTLKHSWLDSMIKHFELVWSRSTFHMIEAAACRATNVKHMRQIKMINSETSIHADFTYTLLTYIHQHINK
jgi:hypothetical protein